MHWLDILVGGSAGTVITGGLGALGGRYLKRLLRDVADAAVKDIKEDVIGLKVKLAAETGGNSNGLRQKLNSVAEDVAHLKGAMGAQQGSSVTVNQGGAS